MISALTPACAATITAALRGGDGDHVVSAIDWHHLANGLATETCDLLVLQDDDGSGRPASDVLELVARYASQMAIVLVGGERCVEARAYALIRAGARDYLDRSRIGRLAAVVDRELVQVERLHRWQRAERELRASEERFRVLVEAALEGVVVHDQGQHLMANPAFAHMLGYTLEEVATRTSWDFLAPESHALVRERMQSGSEEPYEAIGLRKDGSRFDVEIVGKAMPYHGRSVRVVAVRDITARKRNESALRLLADAGDVLAGSLDDKTTLDRVARLLVPSLADLCAIDLRSDDGKVTRVATARAAPMQPPSIGASLAEPEPAEVPPLPVARALRGGESILVPDVAAPSARSGAEPTEIDLAPRGIRSYMVVPLTARGRILGAVSLLSGASGRRYGGEDLILAQSLAQRCALAIDNARLYRDAQSALHQRDEFLATVVHDLKNPLTSIKASAQVLRRSALGGEADPARQAHGLERIDAITTGMVRLLDELLDVARLDAGEPLELELAPIDLVALARQVAAEHQQRTRRHRIEVQTALPELVGAWDTVRIERLLANLVGNAVKYSPRGGRVELGIALTGAEPGNDVLLTVSDDGLGIPAADIPSIFDRFRRGANVAGRISGSGIGLASARQVVEQHGGAIEVASVEGSGTTITVRLPRYPPEQALLRVAPDRRTTG